MRRRRFGGFRMLMLLMVQILAMVVDQSAFAEDESLVGLRIKNFSLRDFRGKVFDLADAKGSPVVVAFLGTECPLANLYAHRLRELADRYRDRGIKFIVINSNSQDSISEIANWSKKHELDFPVLKDVGNEIADLFAARRTPEVVLLDRDRIVRYRGRIDDQYGLAYHRPKAQETYLADALDALLDQKPIKAPFTEAVGCHIGRIRKPAANSNITYSRHISRILQDRCVACHRDGEIAPFALTTYHEVAGWAEMIDEVVHDGRMPPWHPDGEVGRFANDLRLPDDEKQSIRQWFRAGAPEGNPQDLPVPRKFTTGWQISEPDLVLDIQQQPFELPATGEVPYQYFLVDPAFQEDKWVRAAEFRPGNRAVVHHMIAFIQQADSARTVDPNAMGTLWLASASPGTPPMKLADGYAKRIPAGSKILFQVHYTTTGTRQHDRSQLGLVFADPKSVKNEVGTWRAANTEFTIPPGKSEYEVKSTFKFRHDVKLLTAFPHLHLRGKSFRFEAAYADGRREVLVNVPRYDFGWQNSYEFATPIRLAAGTRLDCTAVFDNSAKNPNNPDPNVAVRWGDQNWDEMMAGHFEVILDKASLEERSIQSTSPLPRAQASGARRTDQFMERIRKMTPEAMDELVERLVTARRLDSAEEPLRQFAIILQDDVPQVDRIDIVEARDNGLEVILDVHPADRIPHLPGKGLKFNSGELALLTHLRGVQPAAFNSLNDHRYHDLEFMSREFSSSLHVPLHLGVRRVLVNFWSQESSAFPPESFALLRRAAEVFAEK